MSELSGWQQQGEEIPGRGYQKCMRCSENGRSLDCLDWQGQTGGEAGEGL
jgi:hypothetical protein